VIELLWIAAYIGIAFLAVYVGMQAE